jgi:putative transposase
MSGKGNCYDNAAVETFFKSLKAEVLWRQTWPTRRQAETAIFQYINGFYNPRRRHSYLGGISPSHSRPRWHSEIGDRHKSVTSPILAECTAPQLGNEIGSGVQSVLSKRRRRYPIWRC